MMDPDTKARAQSVPRTQIITNKNLEFLTDLTFDTNKL